LAYGVGTVLSQMGKISQTLWKHSKPTTHPIVYYSATFTPTERNYNIYKWELLVIMKLLAHWQPYLGWTIELFTILTDHANLQYWKALRNLNWRTARWHADQQEYDYEIQHVSGKVNIPADILSHPPRADQGESDNWEVTVLAPHQFINTITVHDAPFEDQKRALMLLVHNHSMMSVTGSRNEASSYASWTRVSSGTGRRYLSDSITVWFDWWLRSWLMDLEAILTLFDRYSLASIVLDRFRVSCMWLDGGLILCLCLYDKFMYLRGSNLVQKRQVESPVNILGIPHSNHSRAPLTH
jgi:hypothetical protein